MRALVFETALGHAAVALKGRRIFALCFGHSSERAAIKALGKAQSSGSASDGSLYPFAEVDFVYPGSDELVDRICAYAEGEAVQFDDYEIDTSHLTPFGKQVTQACRQIARGETRTYGNLAQQVGHTGAARAVGSVMARNRVPLIVPCHRVVPASGGLGGFSAPQGVAMKQRLLDLESADKCLVH